MHLSFKSWISIALLIVAIFLVSLYFVTSHDSVVQPREHQFEDQEDHWEYAKAQSLALHALEATNWKKIDPKIDREVEHSLINSFDLPYRKTIGKLLIYATRAKGEDCHACAPYLSFFEFETAYGAHPWQKLEWKLTSQNIALFQNGSFGTPPHKRNIEKIGEDTFGVIVESGYMAQGWSVEGTDMYVRIGNSYQQVLGLITSQGYGETSWDSKLSFSPTPTGLYDLFVTRTGSRGTKDLIFLDGRSELKDNVANSDGKIRPKDVFKFDGEKYKLVTSDR